MSTDKINAEWAIHRLKQFLEISESHVSPDGYPETKRPREEVLQDAQIVEQILDRVLPGWDRTPESAYEQPGSLNVTRPRGRSPSWSSRRNWTRTSVKAHLSSLPDLSTPGSGRAAKHCGRPATTGRPSDRRPGS